MSKKREKVGILGFGEIGSAMARLAKEAGFKVLIRELTYNQYENGTLDYLYVNIPEKNRVDFVNTVVQSIRETNPKLVIINSSTTPGTTRAIYKKAKVPVVHSPVIGLHPGIYDSIKNYFPKIIGPVNDESYKLAQKHLKSLGLKTTRYDTPEDSEAAKLLDLVYYAWNIVFCKWMKEMANSLELNFDQIYTKHNKIYNKGYSKLLPNMQRPIMIPHKGPITGHCTIPDTELIHKMRETNLTQFILDQNKKYYNEVEDVEKSRKKYINLRKKLVENRK